jgi:hypothetical protein
LAFNKRVTGELGLTETGELVGMKRKGDGQAGCKRKKTKGGEEDWSAEDAESEGSGSDVGESDEREREWSPVKTRGRKAVSKPNGSTAAKWAETAKKRLKEVDGGDDWAALVDVWWALEASWVFASSVSGFFG